MYLRLWFTASIALIILLSFIFMFHAQANNEILKLHRFYFMFIKIIFTLKSKFWTTTMKLCPIVQYIWNMLLCFLTSASGLQRKNTKKKSFHAMVKSMEMCLCALRIKIALEKYNCQILCSSNQMSLFLFIYRFCFFFLLILLRAAKNSN